MNRCHNPSSQSYKRYGGAGVTVCSRWHNFENFLSDMGERPAGTTLDRFPASSKQYSKEMCRWANYSQQAINRKKRSRTTSKYIGVSFKMQNRKWVCQIAIPQGGGKMKQKHLGYFEEETAAAQAYDLAASKAHGKFANLNFRNKVSACSTKK